MRCTECNYPLWNTPAGNCPECGSHFRPSEHAFHVGEVLFRCPDCAQDYYGDDIDGHLRPNEFDCVKCERHLHEDDISVDVREEIWKLLGKGVHNVIEQADSEGTKERRFHAEHDGSTISGAWTMAIQVSSVKRQAFQGTSRKRQAPSTKVQASSRKRQAQGPRTLDKVSRTSDQGA